MRAKMLLFHLQKLIFGPIYQIDRFCGTRYSGIEPPEIVGRKHVFGYIALVYENALPLSALRLVAGDGIGELNLKGVEVAILPNRLVSLALRNDIKVVLLHLVE